MSASGWMSRVPITRLHLALVPRRSGVVEPALGWRLRAALAQEMSLEEEEDPNGVL